MKDRTVDGPLFIKIFSQGIIPRIREVYRSAAQVYVQMDKAGAHISNVFKRFIDIVGKTARPHIIPLWQPGNSPDLNACDLGFFRTLEAMMGRVRSWDLDTLWKMAEKVYWAYPSEKIRDLFVSQRMFFKRVAEANGRNDYDKPHKREFAADDDVFLETRLYDTN